MEFPRRKSPGGQGLRGSYVCFKHTHSYTIYPGIFLHITGLRENEWNELQT